MIKRFSCFSYLTFVVFVIAVFLVLFSCQRKDPSESEEKIEEAPIYVHAVKPELRPMEEVIEVHGNLEAVDKVEVTAKTSGEVVELLTEEGDKVSAGQVLARLEDNEARLSLEQARSAYRVARSDYLSTKELYEQGMKSRSEMEKMKRSYDDARSNLEMAELRLSETRIKSPIKGIVVNRKIELHDRAGAMEQLFTVADLSEFKVPITVTESEVSELERGQEVRVRVDALTDDPSSFPFEGEVSRISPRVDPQTGTVQVEVTLPNQDPRLRVGMFARLKIVTELHPEAMVIPRRAPATEDGNRVWVVKGDGAHMVRIKRGLIDEHGIEVVSGLSPDDKVIVDGQSALTSKSKVVVKELPSRKPAGSSGSTTGEPDN
ncbi:MAG: efflux RND transporter periplasmic adaptor subunit [bacterium]